MASSLALVAPLSTNRDALAGALAFLEGSAAPGFGVDELSAWFEEHLVATGAMRTPLLVTEPSAGTVALYESRPPPAETVARIVVAARSRVVTALRGLLATPMDDRFLAAAIFAGRVSRQRAKGSARWVARIESTTPLSGVVLSLFAVDVLTHRDIYDNLLSVCDTCNRVTFDDVARRSCPAHTPHESGIFARTRAGDRS
jgi:hypothetical protein